MSHVVSTGSTDGDGETVAVVVVTYNRADLLGPDCSTVWPLRPTSPTR